MASIPSALHPHSHTGFLGYLYMEGTFLSLLKALNPALNTFGQDFSLSGLFNTSVSYSLFK